MGGAIRPGLARLCRGHGGKALRYCGVSAVNVAVGATTLAVCHGVLGMRAVGANLTAWMVGAVPAYLLSRAWVWQQDGAHRVRGEMIPFWAMALVGLTVSSAAVELVDRFTDRTVLVLAGNLAAYGTVWVAKYLFLDRVMWPSPASDDVELAGVAEASAGR